ncbi:suppression of tumorigenicity 5 st5 [Anaeramoeba flamelloides]|uniref:Suppression of tumorigenicity 5 st5 n=1 Tax=Anaeramoeba flamelloides TaxID=1746091 RepID=A0ABQ8XVK0_9EUKA|nr:suppression of tumorigenicity 5 st5 [Anaeramoeba flamelloides]
MFFEKFFILKHIIESGKNELCFSYPTIKNDQDYKKVEPFCFTDLEELTKTNKKSQQTFSFVLTNTKGERSYGICRRIFTNNSSDIDCYVFITRHPLFTVFSRILAIIEVRNKIVKGAVIFFLKRLWKRSIPKRGTKFTLYIPAVYKIMPEAEFHFNRSDSSLADFDAERFFIMHEPKLIISLFAAVLFEKKIICSSANLQRLTNALHTIAALVHPFAWPVETQNKSIRVFNLFIYKNIYKQYDNKNAENAFLDFFIQILSDIPHFMQLQENGEVRFSQNYWKSQKEPKIEKLLDTLVKTQIFQSYVESEEKKMKLKVNTMKETTDSSQEIEIELTPFEKHVKKLNKEEEDQGFFIGLYPSNDLHEEIRIDKNENETKNEEKVLETLETVRDRLKNFIKNDSNINLKAKQNLVNKNKIQKMEQFDNNKTDIHKKIEELKKMYLDKNQKLNNYLQTSNQNNANLTKFKKSKNLNFKKSEINLDSDIIMKKHQYRKRANTMAQPRLNLYNTKTSETLKKLHSPKLPLHARRRGTFSSTNNLEIQRILSSYEKKK